MFDNRCIFLYSFHLSTNLRNKHLNDLTSHLKVPAKLNTGITVKFVCVNNVFGKFLLNYPDITKLPDPHQSVKHNTVHYVNSKGPRVAAKPRRSKLLKLQFMA